jgi:hypothetical protein
LDVLSATFEPKIKAGLTTLPQAVGICFLTDRRAELRATL